ncbi:MAG: homoserine O-succinyltransferase [Lachnospirales bacterium]
MPIIVRKDHPANSVLQKENIFVIDNVRAETQDIRPLKVLLLNLMPNKLETEIQFFKLLANSPLQIDMDLLFPVTHDVKNTSKSYLDKFYHTFDQVKNNKYDAMIVTGAPVEKMDFEDVNYWKEIQEIFDYSKKNVTSTLFICWASQAALYHFYGIEKCFLEEKLSGVYTHENLCPIDPLLRGFDDEFFVPQSRYTGVKREDVDTCKELEVLAYSELAGVNLVATKDKSQIFVSGHCEYDTYSLDAEYQRDVAAGINPKLPINYYKNNDPKEKPLNRWQSHGNLLFSNWLNYYVYQITPFKI